MTLQRIRVQEQPRNEETPFAALATHPTPDGLFYVRCNFDIPALPADDYTFEVVGAISRPVAVRLADLRDATRAPVECTLECAGNARTQMRPVPAGTPWGLGAIGSARFGGVPLRTVLEPLGISPSAVEVLFTGHDAGAIDGGRVEHFARSLPLAEALRDDVILAWEMNGAPLRPEHGAPLRLVVPGWYGIASVKWIARIELLEQPFDGHFQKDRYIYRDDPFAADGTPVTRARVRSLIVEPAAGATLAAGSSATVRGIAVSGTAPIATVEVRIDGGPWQQASLEPQASPWLHAYWSLGWTPGTAGGHVIEARATDAAGNRQPIEVVNNALGYGNNSVHRVAVEVVDGG
jgi:DMSO/TMAO reductase YedYZ molybdopterin-dependent catalytic subunit